MAVSANTVKKFNALSVDNKKLVVNLIDRLDQDNAGKTRFRFPDVFGILSLKLVDWFSPKSDLSDEDVNAYITSVRAERRENRK